ncbi:CHAP domain-containing protein [Nonomuraea sp. NPDC050310]|uniref:CHAP domain-containing protein n=1 Tax=unclassified Nonomuraea TaxID=2593643 RepID=UPI0034006CE3
MRPELGYREKGGQHTKFGEWYADRLNDSQYRNAPWCDMFLAWAADKAGVAQYVGQFAWTPSHAAWFINQNAWSATPEPGALVFFDWQGGKSYKGIDHVGIVERVAGKKIHTIEANVDRVWLKRKTRTDEKVVGYGLPRKVKEALQAPRTVPSADAQSPLETVKVLSERDAPEPFLAGPIIPLTLLLGMVLSIVVGAFRFTGRRGVHRRPIAEPAPLPTPVRLHPYEKREKAGAGK